MRTPKLSVVIPVYNEEAVLPTLFSRLYPVLDALNLSYEIVFVNDGSKDRSAALVECSFLVAGANPNENRWSFRNMDLAQYLTEIGKPHGIGVSVQPGLTLTKTPLHVAHPGEKCPT